MAALALGEGARPIASLMGMGERTSIALAALVNSTPGHAFELDDIHRESIVHAGSIAVPVALAIAEARGGMRGRELVTALVAGYEVGHRAGSAATMSLFFRGFHPQGTSGVFVAAATAARAMNLDAGRFQHALGIAGSQAGGLMAAQEGAMVKRLHSGRAAQSGVYSALLAADGFTGITDVLEAGYGGYLSTLSDRPNAARLTAGLGSQWETLAVGYKPHAAVTSIHTALDGLAAILREEKLGADDVAAVEVGLSPMTHVHCAWEYRAQGVTAAQMNLYYGLAVIALDGVAFTDQYREERLTDPRILDFIGRITARVDPEIEAMGPGFRHAARVKVLPRAGSAVEKLILNRRGSPEDPLSPADIEDKFRHVLRSCVPPERSEKILGLASRLEMLESTRELTDLVALRVDDRNPAADERR
ncbi:MAG: MmgE/PrpD family protein [Burkholderiales bacterium]|nr:MmgE/PrpD family protein [Burkholderiales bacterium]